MAAYIIADVQVTDPDTYWTYRSQTPSIVQKYGGRFIVRGGEVAPLEGDWQAGRVVVIEFPDMAAAKRFYQSPEYRQIIGFRQRAATSRIILVDGYTEKGWEPPL
jgi:uncharacterized protein (DUF1330 family)